jgi:tetratricopeptide (TPR) repeat protein
MVALLAVAAALLLSVAPAGAATAVVHLKNGATIGADSWEVRGDSLVIRQGEHVVVVPHAEVVRIVPGPPAAPAASSAADAPAATGAPPGPGPAPGAPEAAPPPAGGGDASTATREEILRAVRQLKENLARYPLARAETTRRLVLLLCELGLRAYRGRDYDEAIARLREAQTYDPRSDRAQVGLAAAYFAQGRDLYARAILDQGLRDHPDHPEMLALLGDVYYSQERLEEARQAWEKSHSLRPDPAVRNRLDKISREAAVDGEYRRTDAAHFTLKYDGERTGPDLGSQILTALEEQYADLVVRFDYLPPQPIVVVVYPQRQFHAATLAEANVAGLFDGKIRVPIGGLQQIRSEARRVLVHELAHAFIAGKSGSAAPRWLHEGLAQYVEGSRTPAADAAALARAYRDLDGRPGWGETFSYPSSLAFVEFLVEREGFHRLADVLEAMSRGLGEDPAFQEATRYSLKELRDLWGKALAARHLH